MPVELGLLLVALLLVAQPLVLSIDIVLKSDTRAFARRNLRVKLIFLLLLLVINVEAIDVAAGGVLELFLLHSENIRSWMLPEQGAFIYICKHIYANTESETKTHTYV